MNYGRPEVEHALAGADFLLPTLCSNSDRQLKTDQELSLVSHLEAISTHVKLGVMAHTKIFK